MSSVLGRLKSVRVRTVLEYSFLLTAMAYGCSGPGDPVADPSVGGEGGADPGTSGQGGKAAGEGGTPSGDGGIGGDLTFPVCGNGRLEAGEACDDGNVASGDGCDADCGAEPAETACGDGIRQAGEECDDGDLQPGDGCDDECREEECGNSRKDSGEECDPPRVGSCTPNCSIVRVNCGNGDVDPDEECDDGNDEASDGCFECRWECGDKRIDSSIGEECDRGLSPELCSETCQWLPTCGDGEVQAESDEECDPSNGVTCVACKIVDPSGCDGAGGNGSGGEGGCGGGGGPSECIPQAASELVLNGTFDGDMSGWAAHSPAVTLSLANEGDPAPKALDVAMAVGQVRAISGAVQCIPVQPGREYALTARYRIPSDAPAGVTASVTALLYAGSTCTGSFVGSLNSGPNGGVRDAWTPYQLQVDTSALSGPGRLLLRLNTLRPGAVSGSHVLWDSVSLTNPTEVCGNCVVDEGEGCDDGNAVAGDGCSPACSLEQCGDGVLTAAETCDDGNALFGGENDDCSPSCRAPSACQLCAAASCEKQTEACLGLGGNANAGPRRATARSTLCDELTNCVLETSCHLAVRKTSGVEGAFLENCYCGTSGADCFTVPGSANGRCRAQVEAALETTDPQKIVGRLSGSDARYPVFGAVRDLVRCEAAGCGTTCVREQACGDGYRQDRNLSLDFVVNGQSVPCQDDLTTTGSGCSFEECDDENQAPGDGCDEHCLIEACGNHLVQEGENCDDGNRVSGDGCSEDCQAEYTCGDGVVESIEQCDPPGGEQVCSQAEYASNPGQCACDSQCSRVVCGDRKLQRPFEQCDPPDDEKCNTDCKLRDQSPCEICMSEDPDIVFLNDEYCQDAQCKQIRDCMLDSKCAAETPAVCYCGPDASSNCEADSFVPKGACHELIAAGVGPPGLTNFQVLVGAAQFANPTGRAFLVVTSVTELCADACFSNASQ